MERIVPPTNWQTFDLQTHNLSQGFYWWRLKSLVQPDLTLTFLASLRLRCAGDGPSILSPVFDYWDGYRVILPECEYVHAENLPEHVVDYLYLYIEGVNPIPCPFCGKVPATKGKELSKEGGWRACTVPPQYYNRWQFQCCNWWSAYAWWSNPREMNEERLAAFKRMGEMEL